MDYEEKYKKALATARKLYNMRGDWTNLEIESIFPELRESEDERIRKALMQNLKERFGTKGNMGEGLDMPRVLAWLEKQSEQGNNEDEAILHRFSFYSYKDEPNILYLAGLYVNDEYRNKGIGTKILKIADEVAVSMKCSSILLKTEIGSNAERLYKNNGYSVFRREENQVWLEKQGEHANFRNKIQIGDKVTRNQDGVLVNLSQLNRVAKKDEQKPTDKTKLKVSDLVTNGILIGEIDEIHEWGYHAYFGDHYADIPDIENWHKWTIQDARNGDVLTWDNGRYIILFKEIKDNIIAHCSYNTHSKYFGYYSGYDTRFDRILNFIPATKEQRDILEKAITDAGYIFDFEKKELKNIGECNGEDFGIDSLWHAQNILERTLGKVDGYQSDDGILEHKCAINAVKKLYKQKSAWSKEDEKIYQSIMDDTVQENQLNEKQTDWLRDIKYRHFSQPQKQWKPSDEQMKALSAINVTGGISYAGQGQELINLYNDLKKLRNEK